MLGGGEVGIPASAIGETVWWMGFSIESYGNYKQEKYSEIFKGILMKGAIKGAGKAWESRKKVIETLNKK